MPLPSSLRHADLVLSRVDPVDSEAILEAVRASIDALHRWQPWATLDYDLDHAKRWACTSWLGWDAGTQHDWVVRREGSERILGTVGVNQIRGDQANLGYWTRSDATGQGIATTAARLAARFGFDALGLRRIHLHHAVGNEGSRRVAEKVGFVREGTLRQVTTLHGAPIDATFYSLLDPAEITPLGA